MPWSHANIDWNGTGAMVQAIGSVAAILAAIVIDQGAGRRLRQDRAAERREAIADRRRAILNVADVIDAAVKEIEANFLVPGQRLSLSENQQRALKAAQGLIEFYLRQGGDAGAHLTVVLAHAEEIIRRARSFTIGESINYSTQQSYASLLREQATIARVLVAEFDAGVW